MSGRIASIFKRFPALLTSFGARTLQSDPAPSGPTPLDGRLNIAVNLCTTDDIACEGAHGRGQFLARQDRWEDLADEIRQAERTRQMTPGGMPIAELLAFGARSDVVNAVEHALQDGWAARRKPMLDGIMALESMRREYRQDPTLTLIVALAHIDIAWAWRGTGWDAVPPHRNRARSNAHFERAAKLLAPYRASEWDSPALAGAHCALLAGRIDPTARVVDDYETLIDLDPQNCRHMRAFGTRLLPRWFGTYPRLELEARRTAARTQDIWGAGGYTWVCFDAIAQDSAACAQVDVDFFIDGLRDILAARPEQEMVNLAVAYCAVALPQGLGRDVQADAARLRIADCAHWLIRDHLTEVHPLIWAHAAAGFDNNARVTSLSRFAARGRDHALAILADHFRDDIARGQRVTFTAEGPRLHPA